MIWLVSVSSKSLAYWFGNTNTDIESGSPLDRAFQIILLCIALRLLIRRGADWANAMKENFWLSALIAFMLVSVLWSPIPFVSFKRWASEFLAVVFGLLISTEKDPLKAIQCVLRRTIYILIPFSWLLIKYFSQHGVEYHPSSGAKTWIGVAEQKNGLGILASFASFFLVWDLLKRWKHADIRKPRYHALVNVFILMLSLWLLKGPGTYSMTSIIMLAAGLLFYAGLMAWKKHPKRPGVKTLSAIMALVIIYGTAAPLVGKLPGGDYASSLGRDSTLTGRSEIWAYLVPLAMKKPVLGHGFGGFWTKAIRESYLYRSAHNGYLEVLLVLGFVGLLLVSLFILSSCQKAQKELEFEYDWGVLWICWLIMALFNNIAESSLHFFSNLLMAVPIWLAITFKKEKRTA